MPKAPTKKTIPASKIATEAPKVESNGQVTEKPIEREVIYPTIKVKLYAGDEALTAAQAKKLLGWEEESGSVKFGADHVLTDEYGKKVRLHNNTHNRAYDPPNARMLQYEILDRNWELNGETLVIGRTGETISAQHRLVALILAAQAWEQDKERWHKWETEPTLPCIVVLGIDECDRVVNTIDTGKRRSFADVVFRSSVFASSKRGDRAALSRILEFAVKVAWHRTGAKVHAFAPRMSHAETFDFVHRHPRLVDAARHVFEEDGSDGKIAKYLSLGTAAGMLYLMGQGETDPTAYRAATEPTESLLDWSRWDEACGFWADLAGGKKSLSAVDAALGKMMHDEVDSRDAKCALVAKAWLLVAAGKKVTYDAIELKYHEDEEGVRTLAECPTVGGIDLGKPKDAKDAEPADVTEDDEDEPDVDSDQATRAARDRAANEPLKTKVRVSKDPPKVGDHVVVTDEDDGEQWLGTLRGIEGKIARVEADPGYAGEGKTFPAPLANVKKVATASR